MAMVLTDETELARICRSWGVGDSEFFASLQLLKPYVPKKGAVHMNSTTREDVLKFQVHLVCVCVCVCCMWYIHTHVQT